MFIIIVMAPVWAAVALWLPLRWVTLLFQVLCSASRPGVFFLFLPLPTWYLFRDLPGWIWPLYTHRCDTQFLSIKWKLDNGNKCWKTKKAHSGKRVYHLWREKCYKDNHIIRGVLIHSLTGTGTKGWCVTTVKPWNWTWFQSCQDKSGCFYWNDYDLALCLGLSPL